MKVPHKSHVALVDGTRFLLLRNDGPIFEPRLTVLEEPALDPTNYSAAVRNQDEVSQWKGKTDLDELAHAAAAAEWLNAKAIAGEIDQLVVVADPKTLGEMRRHYHSELQKRLVAEIDKELAQEPLEKIEKVLAKA